MTPKQTRLEKLLTKREKYVDSSFGNGAAPEELGK